MTTYNASLKTTVMKFLTADRLRITFQMHDGSEINFDFDASQCISHGETIAAHGRIMLAAQHARLNEFKIVK